MLLYDDSYVLECVIYYLEAWVYCLDRFRGRTEIWKKLLFISRSTVCDAAVDRWAFCRAERLCPMRGRPEWFLRSTAALFVHVFILVVYFIRLRGRLDYLTLYCNDSDLSIHVS